MGKTISRKPQKGLTFEDVWAALMETRERQEETARQIGALGNRFGELVEHMVLPNIKEKFNTMGFAFDKTAKDITIKDEQDRYKEADVDILLENSDVAIAIEVKAKTAQKDVDRHKERMAVLRRWADRRNDKRKFYGAMAGAIMTEAVKAYAQRTGFYTIVQSGDTVKIDVPEGFTPKDW